MFGDRSLSPPSDSRIDKRWTFVKEVAYIEKIERLRESVWEIVREREGGEERGRERALPIWTWTFEMRRTLHRNFTVLPHRLPPSRPLLPRAGSHLRMQ